MSKPQVINYNSVENYKPIGSKIHCKHNSYVKRHLDREGKGVKIIEDGVCDIDAEIQSELKNAGLQNILKLQELRYGTLDNAIARAKDKGAYVDVSKIPDSIAEQAIFIENATSKIKALQKELNLSDDEMKSLTAEKLITIYTERAKAAAASNASQEGGAE